MRNIGTAKTKMEYETTAVISSVEKDFGIISLKFGASTEKLRFSNFNFYLFGIRCNGHLTNIIDVGEEVNVTYKRDALNRPHLIAIWLGDKPEFLCVKPKTLYDEEGVIVHSDDINIIVKCGDISVIINREAVYKNGRLLDKSEALSPGLVIRFDAVPREVVDTSGAEYLGTCGWFGQPEPRIVDRFMLNVLDEDAEKEDGFEIENVLGTVDVIPNDVLAFVRVMADIGEGKVVLFRNSLDVACCSLKDVIQVGDTLSLQLRRDSFNPHSKSWIVVRASKISFFEDHPVLSVKSEPHETCSGKDVEMFPCKVELSPRRDQPVANVKTDEDSCSSKGDEFSSCIVKYYPSCKVEDCEKENSIVENSSDDSVVEVLSSDDEIPEVWINDEDDELEETEEGGNVEYEPVSCNISENYTCVPFKKSWPHGNSSSLLNWPCSATVKNKHDRDKIVEIKHTFGNSSIGISDSVIDFDAKNRIVKKCIKKGIDSEHVMEAESSLEDFNLKRLSNGEAGKRPPPSITELLKYSEPLSGKERRGCLGKIKSLPFYNCAIATVGEDNVPVLVQLKSLVTPDDINQSCCTMNMFVKEGATVCLNVKPVTIARKTYFRAKKCWKVIKCTNPVENDTPQRPTWKSCWGSGAFYRTGYLEERNGRYMVRGSKLEIKQDAFFVKGGLVEPPQLGNYVGCKFTCLVKSVMRSVVCAWTDKVSSPGIILKNTMSVPQGLVDTNKFYESVIVDFPLPNHAVAKIGVVPVVLYLKQDSNGRGIVEFDENNLCIGRNVCVNVEEKQCRNGTCLIATKSKHCYGGPAMVNFAGRVVELPKPVGVIVTRNQLKVSFELCCVIASDTRLFEDVHSWFKYVDSCLEVGSRVRFSAILNENHSIPYRAIEVCLQDESQPKY